MAELLMADLLLNPYDLIAALYKNWQKKASKRNREIFA
jgi:hypothetical protein